MLAFTQSISTYTYNAICLKGIAGLKVIDVSCSFHILYRVAQKVSHYK